jgi:arginine/lysine/ornithine decarboxylase
LELEEKKKREDRDIKILLKNREFVLDIRDVFSSDIEKVKPVDGLGRISAELIYSCPPGYPILIYGERITEHHLPFLRSKGSILVLKQ